MEFILIPHMASSRLRPLPTPATVADQMSPTGGCRWFRRRSEQAKINGYINDQNLVEKVERGSITCSATCCGMRPSVIRKLRRSSVPRRIVQRQARSRFGGWRG
jgi:hypothetical protein